MTREPRTGRVHQAIDLAKLHADDVIVVHIDDAPRPTVWAIKIISIDPMLLHRQHERWVTGIYQDVRCRVLVRAALHCHES